MASRFVVDFSGVVARSLATPVVSHPLPLLNFPPPLRATTGPDIMQNRWVKTAPHPLAAGQAGNLERDILDDVLASLHVDSSALYVFDFHEPWGVEIGELPISLSWTVMEGTVWMRPPNGEPIELERGDTFLLPRGTGRKSYVLASSAEVTPTPGEELWRHTQLEGFEPGTRIARPMHMRWGGDGQLTRVVSAAFGFHDRQLGPLIAALPELLLVRAAETGAAFIDILLRFPLSPEAARRPGLSALVTQTAQLLLVHVIRTYALSISTGAVGWLAGLGDPRIARALSCIHGEPESAWTVASLAQAAGLSRSQFAERFAVRVGQTPMQYLRAWRMHLARDALASGDTAVTVLAQTLGYQSDAAFRAAFRRLTGQPPREFRRNAAAPPRKERRKP